MVGHPPKLSMLATTLTLVWFEVATGLPACALDRTSAPVVEDYVADFGPAKQTAYETSSTRIGASVWSRTPVRVAGEVNPADLEGQKLLDFCRGQLMNGKATDVGIAAMVGEENRVGDKSKSTTYGLFGLPIAALSDSTTLSQRLRSSGLTSDIPVNDRLAFHVLEAGDAWYRWKDSNKFESSPMASGVLFLPDPAFDETGVRVLRDEVYMRELLTSVTPQDVGNVRVDRSVMVTASGVTYANAVLGPLDGFAINNVPYRIDDLFSVLPNWKCEDILLPLALVPRVIREGGQRSWSMDPGNRQSVSPLIDGKHALARSHPMPSNRAILLSTETAYGRLEVTVLREPRVPVMVSLYRSKDSLLGVKPLRTQSRDGSGATLVEARETLIYTEFVEIAHKYFPTDAVACSALWDADKKVTVDSGRFIMSAVSCVPADGQMRFVPDFPEGTTVQRTAGGPLLPEQWRSGGVRLAINTASINAARANAERVRDTTARVARRTLPGSLLFLLVAVAVTAVAAIAVVMRRRATRDAGTG